MKAQKPLQLPAINSKNFVNNGVSSPLANSNQTSKLPFVNQQGTSSILASNNDIKNQFEPNQHIKPKYKKEQFPLLSKNKGQRTSSKSWRISWKCPI